MSFATELSGRRRALGLTIEDVRAGCSALLGSDLHRNTVQGWMLGRAYPRKANFLALMEVLRVPLAERDRLARLCVLGE